MRWMSLFPFFKWGKTSPGHVLVSDGTRIQTAIQRALSQCATPFFGQKACQALSSLITSCLVCGWCIVQKKIKTIKVIFVFNFACNFPKQDFLDSIGYFDY